MKWLWIALAVLAAVVVLVAIVGALLPVAHAAARRITLRQPAAAIFAALADHATMPQWRRDLKSVTELPARNGKRCWREVSGFGPMDLMVEREVPERELVTRIVTEGSPFGGTWTFRLSPKDGGTEVAITENGEVYNVFFRALARFVFGHTATIDEYLKALGAKFGEQVVPVDAEPAPAPP
ncbi:MAG: SRPBCC family protein [Planctomycetota bacterium]